MSDEAKTVFISYRRGPSRYIARAIFENLRHHDYDPFLDVEDLDSGGWEEIIFNQIAARTHFVIILSIGTLERCNDPDDMLRREIEYAIETKRNIIPITVDDFRFDSYNSYLVDNLEKLQSYNALPLHYEFFEESMIRLRKWLLLSKTKPLPSIHPIPQIEEEKVEQIIENVINEGTPTPEQLKAEQLKVQAGTKRDGGDLRGATVDYLKALRLNPTEKEVYSQLVKLFIQQIKVLVVALWVRFSSYFKVLYFGLTKRQVSTTELSQEQQVSPNTSESNSNRRKNQRSIIIIFSLVLVTLCSLGIILSQSPIPTVSPTLTPNNLVINITENVSTSTSAPTLSQLATSTITDTPMVTLQPSDTPFLTLTSSDIPSPTSTATQAECESTLHPRLAIGKIGIVGENGINVRSDMGLESPAIDDLRPNEIFLVIDGPKCSNNMLWFKIDYGRGTGGWIAEGGGNTYFVALFLTSTPTPTITPSPTSTGTSTSVPTLPVNPTSFPEPTTSDPTVQPTPTSTPTSTSTCTRPVLGTSTSGQLRVKQAPDRLYVVPRQTPGGRATLDGKTIETNAIVDIIPPTGTGYARSYACWNGKFWWYIYYPRNGVKGWIEEDVLERYS
jgi:hypothetical protein